MIYEVVIVERENEDDLGKVIHSETLMAHNSQDAGDHVVKNESLKNVNRGNWEIIVRPFVRNCPDPIGLSFGVLSNHLLNGSGVETFKFKKEHDK